jgi:hypothetical protein
VWSGEGERRSEDEERTKACSVCWYGGGGVERRSANDAACGLLPHDEDGRGEGRLLLLLLLPPPAAGREAGSGRE